MLFHFGEPVFEGLLFLGQFPALVGRGHGAVSVLDAGEGLHPVLEKHGFEAFRTFERMVLDRHDLPGIASDLMVAAGPEFG